MQETRTEQAQQETRVPSTWGQYLRGLGPGLVVAMAWLGTGDLIDSSVSGATYGYALMWALLVALIARYFFVSALAKYQLCNNQGDESVLKGFARVWIGFPLIVGIGALSLGFVYQSYIIRGAGTALFNLFGRTGGESWGVFIWSVLVAGVAIFMALRRGQYKILEWVARIASVALIVSFVVAAIGTGIDIGALLRGLVLFDLPPDKGIFGSGLVVVAIIGAVGGSAANLLYPYFMQDKGWRGPAYRGLQMGDLLTGIAAIIVINVLVWVVAAETLGGAERAIESEDDLAFMMETAIGSVGPTILWIGLFFVTFTTFPAYAFGFTKIFIDGLHQVIRTRGARHTTPENDPIFKWLQIGVLLILPLIFAMPFAPNLIVLTVLGSSFAVLTAPIILIGTILLTSSRRFMLREYVNRWWETVILLVIAGIGFWAIYGLITGLIDTLSHL